MNSVVLFWASIILLVAGVWAILYACGIIIRSLPQHLEDRRKKHKWPMIIGGSILVLLWLRMILKTIF
jgi:cytochrome b561